MSDLSILGSLPQWLTLAAVLFILFKYVIGTSNKVIDVKTADVESLKADCRRLEDRLQQCEDNCTAETRKLHEEIFGQRKQHLAEQISLINVILNSVDAPELRRLLKTLESVKAALRLEQFVQLTDRTGEVGGAEA